MATAEEMKAREIAEEAREKEWHGNAFIRDIFLGNFELGLIHPYPIGEPDRPEFLEFYGKLKTFLEEKVDPAAIDRTGEYPPEVVKGLAQLGAFGLKIPKEYGGLGLSHPEYVRTMALLGSYDANITALLSAHQAIGVPNPVKLFGTPEQKKEYLTRCAKGAISAFALTEHAVGSDPGRLATVAEPTEDGKCYILNGQKLWCTNGTLAEVIVVMARNPKNNRINAFIVEMNWPGIKIDHRCRFMGLKALANADISFTNVVVPKENLIGKEGEGLKIALITLNTGRLSLPAATAGGAKTAIEVARKWSNARVQWGLPIGKHEAITHKIADMGAQAFAMESVSHFVADLADRKGYDIRLEAAAAKEWNTVRMWHMLDELLQIRGGRGFETEDSLVNRGEVGIGVERALRDARINLIFEGSSEIMHLFMAREAVDKHLDVAGALVNPKSSVGEKLATLPKMIAFYSWWYPTRWIGWGFWPKYEEFGRLARHLRFVERRSRRLARSIFHGMVVHQAKLEHRQGFLFRAVDVAMELFVMSVTVTRAHALKKANAPDADRAMLYADMFCRDASRKVNELLRGMFHNDDIFKYNLGKDIVEGKDTWLEKGSMGVPYTVEQMTPLSVPEILKRREQAAKEPETHAKAG
ncbi:acyl-CoA dehydrogenase family protein [bacterium]|nr:acyl-CoA dehydrogenase family protein [bacterium]